MPYYVTEDAEGCAGYGVVKEDGELIGCHLTQQDAIDQMVAISLDEGIEPGGMLEEIEVESAQPIPTLRFTAAGITILAAEEGKARREISGLAVPYNVEATVSDGTRVKIMRGALPVDGPAPKLLQNHDGTDIVGLVTARKDEEDGMYFTARISKTRAGDDAIELIKDGAIDAVSIGIDPIKATYDKAGVLIVKAARWRELSIVGEPAFADARITQIAATSIPINDTKESPTMEATNTPAEQPAPAPTAPIWAEARKVPSRLPSAAEWISAYVQGSTALANVNKLIADHQAHHNPLAAAAGDIATTDTPGLLPVPVVGPVYDNINYLRPVVTAIGARAMPLGSGKVFNRPEITTHTSVAEQSTELTTLSSTTLVVSSNNVTRLTFGGTVLLSEQDIDWTDPDSVNIVLQDLAGQYADATDNYAADQLRTLSTNPGSWDGTAIALLADLYEAARLIAANTNVLPTHLFVSPDVWAKIGGLVDGNDRPLFPTVGPMNAASNSYNATTWNGNPLGMTMVVDKNFSAKTLIVGCAAGRFAGFEIYENQRGVIAIDKPEVLGRQISFRGYFATLMIDATKFQRLTGNY
jgi:HK97 family phage prohead protease